MKNRDFFNVDQYPKIAFETTRIEIVSPEKVLVTGKLTMLDKTVEVAFPCGMEMSDGSLKVQCESKIDRTRWGINYGKGKVNDDVEIAATLVFGR